MGTRERMRKGARGGGAKSNYGKAVRQKRYHTLNGDERRGRTDGLVNYRREIMRIGKP